MTAQFFDCLVLHYYMYKYNFSGLQQHAISIYNMPTTDYEVLTHTYLSCLNLSLFSIITLMFIEANETIKKYYIPYK